MPWRSRVRSVEPEPLERLADVEVGLAGGDDPDPVARAVRLEDVEPVEPRVLAGDVHPDPVSGALGLDRCRAAEVGGAGRVGTRRRRR